jgi:hypothetical protein
MKRHRILTSALLVAAAVVVLGGAACRTEVKIPHRDDYDAIGAPFYLFENVPNPPVSAYGCDSRDFFGRFYLIDGHDTRGPSFFWRDAHFVWADGSYLDTSTYDSAAWLGSALPDFSRSTTEEALIYSVDRLLSGLGWWVRHTYIDSSKPLAVTFVVDDADNGPFIEDVLLRHFLFARLRGLSVDQLGIEYTSRPNLGHRDLTPPEGMVAAAGKLWLTPPAGVDNQGLQRTIADCLPGGADHPGYTVRLLEVTTTYLESRRVTLSLTMAAGQTAEQAQGCAADMLALVEELNAAEAAGIAVLRFDAFDAGGAPLIRERWDLDLGRHSSA